MAEPLLLLEAAQSRSLIPKCRSSKHMQGRDFTDQTCGSSKAVVNVE